MTMVDPISALAVTGKVISPPRLFALLRRVASNNDRAVSEEFRNQLDEMTLALAARFPSWNDVPEDERPTTKDARNAATDFADEYENASGNPKRRLLVNAFFGRFNPKFYRSGMNNLLWDYARQLEYPDAVYLCKLHEEVRKQLDRGSEDAMLAEDKGARREWRSISRPVSVGELELEFARRLERIGLVDLSTWRERRDYFVVTPNRGLVEQLREFLWGNDGETKTPPDSEV